MVWRAQRNDVLAVLERVEREGNIVVFVFRLWLLLPGSGVDRDALYFLRYILGFSP